MWWYENYASVHKSVSLTLLMGSRILIQSRLFSAQEILSNKQKVMKTHKSPSHFNQHPIQHYLFLYLFLYLFISFFFLWIFAKLVFVQHALLSFHSNAHKHSYPKHQPAQAPCPHSHSCMSSHKTLFQKWFWFKASSFFLHLIQS